MTALGNEGGYDLLFPPLLYTNNTYSININLSFLVDPELKFLLS